MKGLGDRAVVISSEGFHSRSFTGKIGTVAMKIESTPGVTRWVLRFYEAECDPDQSWDWIHSKFK